MMNGDKHIWSGKKAVALIGIVLISTAVVLLALSPLFTTAYDEWWGVPEDETVFLTKYWPITGGNEHLFGSEPLTHEVAVRIIPAALGLDTDRLYVAGGSRLSALDSTRGQTQWRSPGYIDFSDPVYGDWDPTITVDPIVVNFGCIFRVGCEQYWVFVGTASGIVYAMNDTTAGSSSPLPAPMKIGTLDGSVTGLAVYSGDDYATFSPYDMVAAGSSKGTIYAWQVNSTGYSLMDTISIGSKPVHIAGQPMQGFGPYPLFSPAFYYSTVNRTRPFMYVGSEDGNLIAVDISNLTNLRVAWDTQVLTSAISWSSAPAVQYAWRDPGFVAVFAATDDGRIRALYADNGTDVAQWGGPLRVEKSPGEYDGGSLTQPSFSPGSNDLYVGSSSGYAYSVTYFTASQQTDPIGVSWSFRDFFHSEGSTYVGGPPVASQGTLIFVVSNHDLGPAGPSPEDEGTLFALHIATGNRAWYVSFHSPIVAPAVSATSPETGIHEVMVGTYGGSEYAYDTSGYIQRGSSITCPDGSKTASTSVCTTQPIPVLFISLPLMVAGIVVISFSALRRKKSSAT